VVPDLAPSLRPVWVIIDYDAAFEVRLR
jgi:hypothetical protein